MYLNGKHFISCEQNGEGTCNVGTPETWYQARDKAGTITAVEVPIYPETGLQTTDEPTSPLIRSDDKGRAWGGNLPQYNKNYDVIFVMRGVFSFEMHAQVGFVNSNFPMSVPELFMWKYLPPPPPGEVGGIKNG